MDWKKELDFFKSPDEPLYVAGIEELQDFISTEIIKKLIADVELRLTIKELLQLKDKWL